MASLRGFWHFISAAICYDLMSLENKTTSALQTAKFITYTTFRSQTHLHVIQFCVMIKWSHVRGTWIQLMGWEYFYTWKLKLKLLYVYMCWFDLYTVWTWLSKAQTVTTVTSHCRGGERAHCITCWARCDVAEAYDDFYAAASKLLVDQHHRLMLWCNLGDLNKL